MAATCWRAPHDPSRHRLRVRRCLAGHGQVAVRAEAWPGEAAGPLAPLPLAAEGKAGHRHGLGRRQAVHQGREEGVPAARQVMAAQGQRRARAGLHQEEAAVSTTSDRNDPRLTHGSDAEPVPMAEVYLVLSDEERAKGFVRPVRRAYRHQDPECGAVTCMGQALAETYARDPALYGATCCCGGRMHRPVVVPGEVTWLTPDGPSDMSELVGT